MISYEDAKRASAMGSALREICREVDALWQTPAACEQLRIGGVFVHGAAAKLVAAAIIRELLNEIRSLGVVPISLEGFSTGLREAVGAHDAP